MCSCGKKHGTHTDHTVTKVGGREVVTFTRPPSVHLFGLLTSSMAAVLIKAIIRGTGNPNPDGTAADLAAWLSTVGNVVTGMPALCGKPDGGNPLYTPETTDLGGGRHQWALRVRGEDVPMARLVFSNHPDTGAVAFEEVSFCMELADKE